VPAAWSTARHGAVTLGLAGAMWVADRQRPATITLSSWGLSSGVDDLGLGAHREPRVHDQRVGSHDTIAISAARCLMHK
jgi:hypothetical protein